MHKITLITALLLLFVASATATPNTYTLHQINSTHWYFETTQNDLSDGTYNYQAFANNISSDYRILEVDVITPPSSITSLTNITGNFYHNWTWTNPQGADFNYTVVYINDSWVINTSNKYYNLSTDAHNKSTISTHTVDTNGNINTTWVNYTSILPNNPVSLIGGSDWRVDIGDTINANFSSTDLDGDIPTYYCSRTDLFTDFNTSDGAGNFTTDTSNTQYTVIFGVADGWGSQDNYTMSITTKHLLSANLESSFSLAGILPIVAVVIAIFSLLALLFSPTSKMDFGGIGLAVVSVIVLLIMLYLAIELCNTIATA